MRVLAGLIFLCFSLTHAGAAVFVGAPFSDGASLKAEKSLAQKHANLVLCGASKTSPEKQPSQADCHFLPAYSAILGGADYLHVTHRNIKNRPMEPPHLRFLRPPIA